MDENSPARGPDVETASQLQSAELERDWAARRLELSRGLDNSIQQAIAGILNAAAETRQAVEAEAKLVLDRLRHERARLIEDIRDYRRQREGLAAEISETRRRAEEEAGRIRRAAETERTQMLAAAEQRRTELVAEIQRLEEQLADVSSGIQSLLQEQIGRVRGELGAAPRPRATSRPATPAAAPTSPAPVDPAAVAQAGLAGVGTAAGATLRPPPAEPRPPGGGAPMTGGGAAGAGAAGGGGAGAGAQAAGSGAAVAPQPAEITADAGARGRRGERDAAETPNAAAQDDAEGVEYVRAPEGVGAGGVAPASLGASQGAAPPGAVAPGTIAATAAGAEPAAARGSRRPPEGATAGPSAVADVSAASPVVPPPPPPTGATGYTPTGAPTEPDPAALGRVEVAVTNTPSFARALEFQRGVQRTEGVRQVQALQFEHGTLVLAVEHDPGLDVAATVGALPGLGLQLVRRTADRVEFAFPDG